MRSRTFAQRRTAASIPSSNDQSYSPPGRRDTPCARERKPPPSHLGGTPGEARTAHGTTRAPGGVERPAVPVNHPLQPPPPDPHRQPMPRLASDLKLASTDLFRTPDEL